ncbi:MAG: tetratricopeptide repeat-containing sensor histidine kinase [Flavobacterium sp.]|nr:tetratricopeptide repeat-containing sensor histidine kinase [Flavobacterium sp.]
MKKIGLLIAVLHFHLIFAQDNYIDSLKTVLNTTKTDTTKILLYNELAQSYQYNDTELGLKYANLGLQLSKKISWEKGMAQSYSTFGINYYVQNEIKKALYSFNQALHYCKNDKKAKSKILKNIGAVYNTAGNYDKALRFNLEALKISEEINDKDHTAKIYTNMGNIYYYLNDTKRAITYYKKSLFINQKLNNKPSICKNLQNIGSALIIEGKDIEAKKYYTEALKIAENSNDKETLLYNYFYLGNIENNLNNPEKALNYLDLSEKIATEIGNSDLMILTAKEKSAIYLEYYRKTKNKEWLAKSEKITLKILKKIDLEEDLQTYMQINKLASELYEEKRDFKKSFYYLKEFNKLNDSILSTENKETLRNLENKKIIEIKEKQLQINNLELKAKEKQKWYFMIGLLLLSIIGALLFFQNQSRKKTNHKLQLLNSELNEANKAKTRFFSILNHDLRGPVANLVFFLQLQKESPELLDEESIQRMQDKTMTGAENLLASMEDILQWSKSQMENFKPQPQKFQIATLFEDTQKHFLSVENVQFQFENPNNLILVSDENYLKTIVRNLTGNAVKALAKVQNPTIVWKAFQENGKTTLSITDNGKGASQEEFKALYDANEVTGIKTGLGLHLIRDLAKAIDCEISVNSKINEGTTITLKL